MASNDGISARKGEGSMSTGESRQRTIGRLGLAMAGTMLLQVATAQAIYLDKDQKISLRGRIYSQFSIRTEDSPSTENVFTQPNPEFKAGQLVQNRFFYNPELDAELTDYTKFLREIDGLRWLAPDDFGFRVAAWGFYDGIYDYGSSQYNTNRTAPRTVPTGTLKPFVTAFGDSNFPLADQTVTQELRPCVNQAGCIVGTLFSRQRGLTSAADTRARLAQGESLEQIFEPLDARDVYASQNRVNELYLNYSKGPLFVRLGRQSISWGESDTIALLDVNNPFDITLGVPGIFQDLDESRIPLWTLRTSYQLFSKWGPFSSGFIEGYWVPGAIDQNIAVAPMPLGQSPYGPSGIDPHLQLVGNLVNQFSALPNGAEIGNSLGDTIAIVLVDKLPEKRMKRSRGGVRFETIVGREHTVSGWWYRTYNNAPVAFLAAAPNLADPRPVTVSTLERADVDVFGLSDTFFFEAIDTIVRAEAEYFLNELSFLEWRPAPPPGSAHSPFYAPSSIRQQANIPQDGSSNYGGPSPRTNHLRWELGLDRFLFIRWLNPTNSFLASFAWVGDYNLDQTFNKRYGFGPGRPTKAYEGMFQFTTQTDYMHGKIQPRLTAIYNWAGAYAFNATVNYRLTDYLLFGLQYALIDGDFHQIGFFRDYDQVALRVTYQLN